MKLRWLALGCVALGLSYGCVQAGESAQARIEGIRCWSLEAANSPPILVCVIGEMPDPINPIPGPDTAPDFDQPQTSETRLVFDYEPSYALWLTAQPSEPPQTQPHTP